MTATSISGKQMKRLQTLWGMFARHAKLEAKDKDEARSVRLAWIGNQVGKQLTSFRELTFAEANAAIEAVQKYLPAEMLKTRRPSRSTALAYGTAGRRGQRNAEVRLVDAPTLKLLDSLLQRLGWTRERLDAFLRSRKSPVRSGKIRTMAEANQVIWPLKGMLRRAGASEKARTSPASTTAVAPGHTPAPPISNDGADREIGVPGEAR